MSLDLFLCCPCISKRLGLPKQYKPLNVLGKGGHGFVVRCKKKDTDEIVAVKISDEINTLHEIHMMRNLMSHNFDQHNIVRFLGSFSTPSGLALVMEDLDINLSEYLNMLELDLMPLSDIRHIIKQVAVALDALKSIRVIHGDIKPDNIMMVDRRTRPFRVKVIDFGSAIPISEAEQGNMLQHRWYRAPEVILGVPFTEAIDMWSLGCVMAMMFIRRPLFRGWTNFEIMECIVHHCGQPPEHLLNKGLYTKKYFSRTENSRQTIEKRLQPNNLNRCYEARIKDRLDNKNEDELLEAFQCLDLLRAMLRVDPAERITPAEVLLHPFILEIHQSKTSRPASWTSTSDCEDPVTAQEERETTNIQPAHQSPSPTIPPSRVIYVRPATAENTLRLEDLEDTDSLVIHVSKTSRPASWTSTSDCEDPVTAPEERETTNLQPAHRSPSPTTPPSRVIYVRPATAENTLRLEDQESLDSLVIHVSKTSRPASWTSTSDCEDPVTAPEERETTNLQPAHRSPSPTIPSSRVIYVRPATAENTLRLEDQESLDSFRAGLKNSSESPVTITENDTTLPEDDSTVTSTLTSEDITYYGKKQLPQSPPPVTDLSSKKKKKKNCFPCFSWMKKTFCSCVTCADDD